MKKINDYNLGDLIKRDNVAVTPGNDYQSEVLEKNVEHIKQFANLPKRYSNANFLSKTPKQEELIKLFKANYNGKNFSEIRDMLIYGDVGTGKTHLTVAFLHKLINANIYCRYITEHNLLDLKEQKKHDVFNAFRNVNVLVIDEVGKRNLVDWQMIHLEELIGYRYNEVLPTIYITNMDEIEFKNHVGTRVADRLRENKVMRILMDGESLRGK